MVRPDLCQSVIVCLLAAASVSPALAQTPSFTFEGFVDGTVLTTQYTGAAFSNAIILGTGITLNEFEFPPHSATNVASDNGGPMTILFSSPPKAFSGYFTYGVPLTLQALDSSNHVLATATSAFSNNQALSGASGSHTNELLSVSSGSGISKIVITGSAQGASFALDDVTVISRCDLNQDGVVNVLDAQAILNEALGKSTGGDDLDRNGTVNVVDVQIVINAALALGCAAS
jgi:hypothetical protein